MSGSDWVVTFRGWGVAIKETAQHYWVGTKLLWADVRVASRLLLKVANGKSLSRRERKQLTRTVADVFRLVPFAIFVIVPFMEFLLPVFLRFFPNMLPSTFQDKMKEEVGRHSFSLFFIFPVFSP
jgi:LETM1 and EF-hand domain-containing protein 1